MSLVGVFCVRSFQLKKSCFVKVLRKKIEPILAKGPGKAPAQEVVTLLSRTFHPREVSATFNDFELFMLILVIADRQRNRKGCQWMASNCEISACLMLF